jgi:rSAM/selenodomain-associated transferase 1
MAFMTATARTLGVLAKRPIPGAVKTRLAAETSAAWAARVAEAFLLDALERLAHIDAHRVLAYTPRDSEDYFADLVNGRYALTPQPEGDLGRRLAQLSEVASSAAGVVLVGTDSPTLPPEFVERAFAELRRCDVVLGPATDGGYYLIGCVRPMPTLFEGVAWGGSEVLRQTVARLPEGCRLALLPPWYDVDTLADWHALRGHLAALRRAGTDPQLPRTEAIPEPPLP